MEAPVPTAMNQEIIEKLYIEQDNIKYLLTLNAIGDIISFNLEYNFIKSNYFLIPWNSFCIFKYLLLEFKHICGFVK